MTPIRQNCNQTQWKGLSIKGDIVVNVDVFNRRLVTQLPKVALGYEVDLSRYCRTRKCFPPPIYVVLKHVLILFIIHISIVLDRNLQTVSFPMLYTSLSVIRCFGFILQGSVVINTIYLHFVYRLNWKVLWLYIV